MSRFFFGMLAGAALLYVAMHFHFVRGESGVFLLLKRSNMSDVCVDNRNWAGIETSSVGQGDHGE